ncbi:fructosamine kinase family protein [Antarctobacter jejuensis]|uniref:fructosamine kinase family protein n=1 Tax=Antarctobacter jejuensis TaxID=1439938 RepID=UPI003FD66F9C
MSWQARVAQALGAEVASAVPVQGGDLSEVYRADLADGRRVAVKIGPLVGVEAGMLRALAEAGAAAPHMLWCQDDLMCLHWLDETRATPDGWRALGETLRCLHGSTGPGYGWPQDYAFGTVRIDNRPGDDWPAFWAQRRLLPFVGSVPQRIGRRLSVLAARLPELLPPAPAPALLHGDLWTGNALFSGPQAYLIDPACYHGHAEVDLAMLTLFGRPDDAFWTGYGAPAPDWQARRPIYQLWPALVHLSLFGTGYVAMVEGLLDQAGV